jgi:predicted Ser/Thr protein kinase
MSSLSDSEGRSDKPLGCAPTRADNSGATSDFSSATTNFSHADESDQPKTELPTERPPVESIANYDLLAELGRGGMGIVYKAQDRRLGRLVALKVILAGGHAGSTERKRFQIEVEAAAKLQHANIVQVHEVGEDGGRPYMSMEYCPGGSLEDQIRDKPQPPREAAQLVATLADALHEAHKAGIVHRDVKPANVLLAANDAPKLADFGLAKSLNSEDSLTQTGAIMGSLGYMAPEQAVGRTRDATAATDIYSLGALLYKLLTGRPPFQGPTQLDTINSIVATDPVSIQVLQRRVPQDLVTICHKCLEKSPTRRYPTAAALAEDLRRYLADEPIQARPLAAIERAWRWARRHPGPTFVLLAGVAMLLLVAVCLAWSSYRTSQLMADVHDVQRPLQELSGRIRYLDEVLTSSALLASSTGDTQWQNRYDTHVAQLDAALQEAVRLAPGAEQPLAKVDTANAELVAMETTAFETIRKGHAPEAWELLNGTEYRAAKDRYGDALTAFIAHLEAHQHKLLVQAAGETKVFVVLAAIAAAVILLLIVVGGWAALRLLRGT